LGKREEGNAQMHISNKQSSFIGWFLPVYAILQFVVFFLVAFRAGQTEEARMTDQYTATLWDKVGEWLLVILVWPSLVLGKTFQFSWLNGLFLAVLFNTLLAWLALLIVCFMLDQLKLWRLRQ